MIRTRRRPGFTMIELLVVIVIIGILIGILLPVIQAAREAARRVQCASNMKMIGLAIHQHIEARGHLPGGYGKPLDASYLFQVLPYLEQANLYNAFNVTHPEHSLMVNENGTAMTVKVATFLCLSDSARNTEWSKIAPNYAANACGDPISGLGPFTSRTTRPQDIPDGLSQTAGVAEWIVGPGDETHDFRLGSLYYFEDQGDLRDRAAFAIACERAVPDHAHSMPFARSKGFYWATGGLGFSQYTHAMTPNRPSCNQGPWFAVTAGSFHPGGANVLLMDGRVRFVKQTIDPEIWYALGTSRGGEIVGGDALE